MSILHNAVIYMMALNKLVQIMVATQCSVIAIENDVPENHMKEYANIPGNFSPAVIFS